MISEETPNVEETRIDRVNLLDYLQPNSPPQKVLYLCTIQDAVASYLYAFLGKNGISAEEFFSSWQYLFRIVSSDPTGWNHHRTVKHIIIRDGKRTTNTHYLTDNELKLMCFDKHYEMSGLENYMNIDKFRTNLKSRRKKLVEDNWEKVSTRVNEMYQKELGQIADDKQIPLQIWTADLRATLIDPYTPQYLANSLYVSNKLKRPKTMRNRKKSPSRYAELANRMRGTELSPLDNDWGPLASYLRRDNVETTSDNSNNSILCNAD